MKTLTLHTSGGFEFSAVPDPPRKAPRVRIRGFEAGRVTRTNRDFPGTISTVEMDWLSAALTVRQRARDMIKNNDYAKKALNLFRVNVVGPTGFKFQSDVKELVRDEGGNWIWQSDETANTKIEQALKDWSKRSNCSISGMYTLHAIEDLLAQYWFRDGEAILWMPRNPASRYAIQCQIIEPEALDESLNTVLPNGNVVKMGVELDQWRRPVNYYIRKKTQQGELYGSLAFSASYDILPAAEVIHLFDREFVNQTRGISLLVQSMLRLRMLTGYEEACLFNARAAANKQLIVRNRENDLGTQTTQDLADGTDEFGNPVMTLEPGTVLDIGDKDAVPFSPEFPTAQHESFMKSTLHGISAGVGMAYSSVTNDLGDTSYSSGRIGLIEERDMWKLRQQVFIEQVLNPLFERWLPMAILSGQVALPMAKIEKFMQPVWIGRRWSWVDPLKDLAAMALAREIKVETLTQQLAEKGDDLIETLTEFKEEEKAAQQLGLTTVVKSKEAAPPAQEGDPAGTPAEKSPNAEKGKRYLDLALALLAEDAGTNGKGH